ncbi:MAG: T9SS type A sorting domain-containing protein [Aureispira sp.]|nr:T9SS type A sorting domain-containing protein [Aureispira sp.]
MNIRAVILVFLGGFILSEIQAQDIELNWINNMGSPLADGMRSIAVDSKGGTYTLGIFRDTIEADPVFGTPKLIAKGYYDIFIQKYDDNGQTAWLKRIGSSNSFMSASEIAVDQWDNIYIAGTFNDTVDFDLGVGVHNVYSLGFSSFLLKLDSDGDFKWVKNVETHGITNTSSFSHHLLLDPQGQPCLVGLFSGTPDFDPSAANYTLSSTVNSFQGGPFVQKLDTSGNLLWAKEIMNNGGDLELKGAAIDNAGNIYTAGSFDGIFDFDPDTSVYTINTGSFSITDLYIQKLTPDGSFTWAKSLVNPGSSGIDNIYGIEVDAVGNVYIIGDFNGQIDMDPSTGTHILTYLSQFSTGWDDFLLKLNTDGEFEWAKQWSAQEFSYPSPSSSIRLNVVDVDILNNVYVGGNYNMRVDLNPHAAVDTFTSPGLLSGNGFIVKLNGAGDYLNVKHNVVEQHLLSNPSVGYSPTINAMEIDELGNIYTGITFQDTIDVYVGSNKVAVGSKGEYDVIALKLQQSGIYGKIFQDFNQDCTQNISEVGLAERRLIIQPGNLVAQTNAVGVWSLDSLANGTYTVTVDTSGSWNPTCPITQTFVVTNPDSLVIVPSFGFISTAPCPAPNVSIQAPILRPGFSNQRVYVQVCNEGIGTDLIDSAYVIVELDSLLLPQSGSLPYTSLGNNQYQVNIIDSIYPAECVNFWLDCDLSINAVLGQSLCVKAELYPVDNCALDTVPALPNGLSACNTPYDNSHIILRGVCVYDTIKYTVINAGSGDMTCFAPVRLYIDGQYILLDSVQLMSGQDTIFAFVGDGRTWRLEVDQHPLHPGSSQPSSTVELCGNASNWTPNLVNVLPQDDADPVRDIFCGVVTGSFDPNDKTGFPLGITNNHNIDQNQDLEYRIRFQNTGTDTAFTVIIRDTLPMELDIFSLREGAASHDYVFRMHGPRVLEWVFPNIMLVDSVANEPESHGFVSFKVKQNQDLPIGTTIENNAGIYFDFNAPIITNKTLHTIGLPQDLNWGGEGVVNSIICGPYDFNGVTYTQTGTYWQTVQNEAIDSLYTLNLSEIDTMVAQSGLNLAATASVGANYQWLDCNTNMPIVGATSPSFMATANGSYAVEITQDGCVDTSACYAVTVVGLDLKEVTADWKLYPNPTKGNFRIDLDQLYGNIQIRILDVQGKLVRTEEYQNLEQLDLSIDGASGLYFIQIYTNKKEAMLKVLKE